MKHVSVYAGRRRFVAPLLVCTLLSPPLFAQSVANDPLETKSQSEDSEVIQLSPFEVNDSSTGYLTSSTMSGTRLNTKLEDIASSISVVTKEQMADFAMLDINDIFAYEAGTEGTGNYTDFSVDRAGRVGDSIQSSPESANRIRGIGSANISFNGFATSGRVPIDPINIDAVEISRGPNSSIFGLGEASGTVNMVASSANVGRDFTKTQLRVDNYGGWRSSLDVNRALIDGKLAVRLSGVYQHDGFVRKPSGFDTKRFNAMVRVKPFKYTSIRASYQSYLGSGTRATTMTPRDGVSDWIAHGSPVWDPVTSTVTVNGVSTAMGATDPDYLYPQTRAYPLMFIGENGVDIWTIGQMPANNATNGPNNVGGVGRLLETGPEDVRTGRPLFSTVPGVHDKNIYDYSKINLAGPNYLQTDSKISMVELEQYFLDTDAHKIATQFAWQREETDVLNRNVIGSLSATGTAFTLYVDPNSRLLDGSINPYFKNTYIGVPEPLYTVRPYERNSYRGQLAYILDFTEYDSKWLQFLGRHQLLGYYEERKTSSEVYRFRDVMINDNPIYAPAGTTKGNQSNSGAFLASPQATRAYYHYYVGDANGYDVDRAAAEVSLGDYAFRWYNPQTGNWVTDINTLGVSGVTEGTAGTFANLNLIKTRGVMLQSNLLNDRLVLTFGRRNDKSYDKSQNSPALLDDGYSFDYEAMDGWADEWGLQEGDTKTSGVVAKPFRGWNSIDRARERAGLNGLAADVLSGLTLFYNKSDSFLPQAPAYSVMRTLLGNTTSLGTDYGFAIYLGNKLSFRASHYTTNQINARDNQSRSYANRLLQVDLQAYGGSNRALPLQRQARAWISQMNPGISDADRDAQVTKILQWDPSWEPFYRSHTMAETQGVSAKGEEYELTYNPNRHWTMKANVTRSESIDKGLAQNVYDWFSLRMPVWETIIDPRTGTKWLDTGYAGELPSPGSLTPRAYIEANIAAPIELARATEGTLRPQIREWRVNFSTSYRLAGLTEHKVLSKVGIGGAIRWESEGAIGYYGVPVNGSYNESTRLDGNNPVYDGSHTYCDAFVSYNTKLFDDKVDAKFQLNVKNLQESKAHLRAVGAFPDGTPHTFRIIDPRQFILTVGFDF